MIRFATEYAKSQSYIDLSDRLDSLDDDAVMIPEDDEERLAVRCFMLSMKSGFNGSEIDYQVVRDFSKKYGLDPIGLFEAEKRMVSAFNGSVK